MSRRPWRNYMNIMENYMKDITATCHALHVQLSKHVPSKRQISLSENRPTLQNQATSTWKLDLKDTISYILS